MSPETPVYAVLVGVEKYSYAKPHDTDWDLNGPANDIHGIAQWLVKIGVPPHRLCMLLSALDEQHAGLGDEPNWRRVSELFGDEIIHLIEKDGNRKEPGCLLVYWSGHGAVRNMGSDQEKRIVFCSDGYRSFSISSLANSLSARLPSFRVMVIVDACAIDLKHYGIEDKIVAVDFPSSGMRPKKSNQCFLGFSASQNQAAINQGATGVGAFSLAFTTALNHMASIKPFGDVIEDAFFEAQGVVEAASKQTQSPISLWVQGRDAFPRWLTPLDGEPEAFPPLPSEVKYLCDRTDQWDIFKGLVDQHFSQHPDRPMAVLAHCDGNQYPKSLVSKIRYEIRTNGATLLNQRCDAVESIELKSSWPKSPGHALIKQRLLECVSQGLRISPSADGLLIQEKLRLSRTCYIFHMELNARVVGSNFAAWLEPILDYWHGMLDVPPRSAVVFILTVTYDSWKLHPLLRRKPLKTLFDPDHQLHTQLSRSSYLLNSKLHKIHCLQPALGSVGLNHLKDWADIHWPIKHKTPTETFLLQEIMKNSDPQPMDHIIGALEMLSIK